jgi:hypothetical protein
MDQNMSIKREYAVGDLKNKIYEKQVAMVYILQLLFQHV